MKRQKTPPGPRSRAKQPDGDGGTPGSPAARRLATPGWLDLRLIVGVVLLLGSVLVGAKIISAADKSATVWGLKSDLAAGTVLTSGDLRKVQVRLYDSAELYVATSTSPIGRTLSRNVGANELLPAAALAEESDYVTVSLAVPAQRVPSTLRRGDRVNIYASDDAADQQTKTTEVATGVTVLEVTGRSSGALSVGSAELQVLLNIPQCHVAGLLDATEGMRVSLAVLGASSTASSFGACPSVASNSQSSPAPSAGEMTPSQPAAPTS